MEKQIEDNSVEQVNRTKDIVGHLSEMQALKAAGLLYQQEHENALNQFWNKMPFAFRDEFNALQTIYSVTMSNNNSRYCELEEVVKIKTILRGETTKNGNVQAVYSKGRTTWDGAKLSGYAVAHPEIDAFKKVGAPSAAIKWSDKP